MSHYLFNKKIIRICETSVRTYNNQTNPFIDKFKKAIRLQVTATTTWDYSLHSLMIIWHDFASKRYWIPLL